MGAMDPIDSSGVDSHGKVNTARARLEERLRAVNEEIRDYPQPIARCDSQLGGLLEERGRIRAELDALDAR
jgi:hypothetical protein